MPRPSKTKYLSDERARHLATFPELNPNPVLEVDLSGAITFANPASHRILQGLGLDPARVDCFLPADLGDVLRDWDQESALSLDREITLAGKVFGELVTLVPEMRAARIFAHEITEHRRAEDALQAQRQLLEMAVNQMPSAVNLIRGSDLTLQLINPAYQAIAPGKEMVGKTLNELWPETGRDFEELCRQVLATGEPHRATDELFMIRRQPDGPLEPAYFSWSLHRVRLPGDEGWGILNTAWETTQRKQMEQALRDSQTQFQALVETTSDFIWEMDARGIYTYCSPQLKTLWGLEPKEMIGKSPFDLVPPEDREQAARAFSSLAASQAGFRNLQVRSFDAAGNIRYLEISGVPFLDAAGELKGFRGMTRDVTERMRAEEVLRQRTEELQAIMEAAPTAIFVTRDPDARTISGNRAARELVALPPDANISKTAPEEERPTGWQEMRDGIPIPSQDLPLQQAARGVEVRDYEMDLVFRDGTIKSTLGNATPLRDEKGQPHGGMAVLVDVTGRKRAEETLREALHRIQVLNRDLEERANQLEVANEELERLATSLSFDLRSPLVSLRSVSRVLAQDYGAQLPPQALSLFQLVQANADEMERLTQGLLQLMRVTRQTVRPQELNTEEIVRAAWTDLQSESGDRQVEFAVDPLPVCYADPLLLKQVWTHLLSNALKATRTRAQARISVGARRRGDRTSYFVQDNGVGFDMWYAGTIFRAFQRYHHSDEWQGGSGVGLAIVESIIRRHGGRVWAEGAINLGATFYFEL